MAPVCLLKIQTSDRELNWDLHATHVTMLAGSEKIRLNQGAAAKHRTFFDRINIFGCQSVYCKLTKAIVPVLCVNLERQLR
jgi:hypothetical protein